MKKNIIILIVFVLFTSCTQTQQDKAEKSVKAYMNQSWKDGYKSLKFTKLEFFVDREVPGTSTTSDPQIKYELLHKFKFENGWGEWSEEQEYYIQFDKDLNVLNAVNIK